MSVLGNRNKPSERNAILAGGGMGIVLGAILGTGLALMSGAFASGVGWFVVLQAAFAMMLMGGWTAPSLMPEEEIVDKQVNLKDEGSTSAGAEDVAERTVAA